MTLKRVKSLMFALVMMLGAFSLVGCNSRLEEYKTLGKTEIVTYAEERKDNYSIDNWIIVLDIVETGKAANYEATSKIIVDNEVTATKTEIDAVEEVRFKLTIAITATTFTADDDIIFTLRLKNRTNESYNIAYFFLFLPEVPTGYLEVPTEMPEFPSFIVFASGETILESTNMGGLLAIGIHEVSYRARFYLNWGKTSEETIEVSSKAITISVV